MCIGGKSILTKKYLVYGYAASTKAVTKFFDLHLVNYLIYLDQNDTSLPFVAILKGVDYIIKSPGIKFNTPLLQLASAYQIKVISDLELLYLIYPSYEYIIVTGTNGKTTTSYLTYQMLKHLPMFKKGLGGNIGIPLFSLLEEKRSMRGFVIEASSFMLHNTFSLKAKVYVLTNLVPHHLDYHINANEYFNDKIKNIYNLDEDDYLIYNLDDKIVEKEVANVSKPFKMSFSLTKKSADCYIENESIYYQNHKIVDLSTLKRKDIGVLYDMMASIMVAKIYHIPLNVIVNELITFTGLEFRNQIIYNTPNLVIINDSKSTSPIASYYACQFCNQHYADYRRILVLGGQVVDLNYDKLNEAIKEFAEIVIFGEFNDQLNKLIIHPNIKLFLTLEEVVNDFIVSEKTLILFSPSCPSYDQYVSYIERGNNFNKLVKEKFVLE